MSTALDLRGLAIAIGAGWSGAGERPLTPSPSPPPPVRECRACRRPASSGRRSVVVLAQQQQPVSRRQLASLAAVAAALAAARPAQAGLFDGGKAAAERYEKDTVRVGRGGRQRVQLAAARLQA